MGVGNLPARGWRVSKSYLVTQTKRVYRRTLGETRTQKTRNLLDERIRGEESIVATGKLLDELLVLVELLQVIGRHGLNAQVFGTIEIVLVTENAIFLSIDVHNHIIVCLSRLGPTYQMLIPGRGTLGSLMVPEKRLSR